MLSQPITTVGSHKDADFHYDDLPLEWLVIRKTAEGAHVRFIESGATETLTSGQTAHVADVQLTCRTPRVTAALDDTLDGLSRALADAESAADALHSIAAAAVDLSGGDVAAIILAEDGTYSVPVALHADGRPLQDAKPLLSDSIVMSVLSSGDQVDVPRLADASSFAGVPSIVALNLQAVLCLPLRVGDATLGALYLGNHRHEGGFSESTISVLKVVAALAVPALGQIRRAQARPRPSGRSFLGDSQTMRDIHRLISRVAGTNLSVLVLGASGTGKELVARAIHEQSNRSGARFVALNCAAVPESLLDSELFGHSKGAFTGAATERAGVIEAADGATLFLDEVGDMPLPMQAALLRVLEQKEVKRLGETATRPVDFRLIAATNRDLQAEVAAGRFREDLLFRVGEVSIELPPLSERGGDIVMLATSFLREIEDELRLPALAFSADAKAALTDYPWPGNVRELRAAVRRAAVLCDGATLEPRDFQLNVSAQGRSTLGDLDRPLADARDDFVARYIEAVITKHAGNREAAAAALGIGVRTLYRYIA